MCDTCNISINSVRSYDPTRTTTLRNAFARNMKSRFRELARTIHQSISVNDAFGLNQITAQQMNPASTNQFNFPNSSDKIKSFKQWLNTQINNGILTGSNSVAGGESWMDRYILDSYRRGTLRARSEMIKAGFDVPAMEATGGIDIAIGMPVNVNSIKLLYTRAYNDLKGITDAMDSQISRILAQGFADGDGAAYLSRRLIATVNGSGASELGITDTLGRHIPAERRAIMLARTEVIRAHHEAMINEYQQYGVDGVKVKAEFMSAGDNRVCDICAGMEGNIYTLENARGLIPVHPQCRCIVLPYKV